MATWRAALCDRCNRCQRMWGRPGATTPAYPCQLTVRSSGDIKIPCGGTVHVVMDPEVQTACQAAWLLGQFHAMRPIVEGYFCTDTEAQEPGHDHRPRSHPPSR